MAIVKMGIVGLGKMGGAIASRVIEAGFEVVGYDLNDTARAAAEKNGVAVTKNVEDLAKAVRIFWLMVPQGTAVDSTIDILRPGLHAGDIIVDGGNSNYVDSMRRAQDLAKQDIFFLDCGTSGGLFGREFGFCLMVGGDAAAYTKIHPILVAIAAPGGLAHVGPSGAGHYVKMIHNGIEYAILQAYAEGFHLIKDGSFKSHALDAEEISRIWSHGAVIRSFILQLVHDIMRDNAQLNEISGEVAQTGMGRWMVQEAKKNNIPVTVIEQSLKVRDWSCETGGNYATKIVAMLRNKFGGHSVKKIKE